MSVPRSPTWPDATHLSAEELGAWRGLLRVHAELVRALDSELEAAHRLPLSSYDVLVNLADAPDQRLRMSELAEAALLSRSGLSRLVDRLVGEGLIERASCPSDARGAFAVITEKGRAALREARPTHLAGVRHGFLDHFDERELRQLGTFWERVLPGSNGTSDLTSAEPQT